MFPFCSSSALAANLTENSPNYSPSYVSLGVIATVSLPLDLNPQLQPMTAVTVTLLR